MMKQLLYLLALSILLSGLPNDIALADQAVKMPAKSAAKKVVPKKHLQPSYAAALKGAKVIGKGCVTAYKKDDSTLMVLPKTIIGRLLLWYSEAVSLPSEAISRGGIQMGPNTKTGTTVVTLERQGKRIFIRDHTPGYHKRVGADDPVLSVDHKVKIHSIQGSVNAATKGPIIAVLPVLEEDSETILVDITQAFSNDIESLTARFQIFSTGLMPVAVDPTRSYISAVRVFKDDLVIRSHLTFLTSNPQDPISGTQPMSIEIGHSIVLLPTNQMQGRLFDNRVGFFKCNFTEYETKEGDVVSKRAVILRRRLEKANPEATVSEPVQPIIYYIGQNVPDRWRPYLKAAVEQWQPVFEAAGFKNAIIARDAPSAEEDPDWSAEDVHHNVIRWISQANANAMGPVIYDPRSGEILSAHIQIWPEVIDLFERYYYSVASSLDPEAARLPMSDKKRGKILQYIVAHEIGHTLGLRHNHLGSTTYTVREMRDPKFANVHGPNSSIMAYGRMNQCAQPGDGVTQILPVIGPYDYFAVNWGYGKHGKTIQEEQATLKQLADNAEEDRRLIWAAGELPEENEIWATDPRLQKENTGAERVEATRLGVANILRSLQNLNMATGGDDAKFTATYHQMLGQHVLFLKSVVSVIGGMINQPSTAKGSRVRVIPADKQRAAVKYLLGDGTISLEPYKQPEFLYRAQKIGGVRAVENAQAGLIGALMKGPLLAMLEAQKTIDPAAYGPVDLADDITETLWSNLTTVPRWRKVLQSAFLDKVGEILHDGSDTATKTLIINALTSKGYSRDFANIAVATGAHTAFPAWAHSRLPEIQTELESAKPSSRSDKLHFEEMARRIRDILATNRSEKTL